MPDQNVQQALTAKSTIMIPECRMSYPKVFKPELNKLNGKMEYSFVGLFNEKSDLTRMKALAQLALEATWGKDPTQWPPVLKSPFRDQNERAKFVEGKKILPPGYVEGHKFVNFKSTKRPGIVDQNVQAIIDESQIYGGCWVQATVRAYTYDQKGNRGVAFGLINIQKIRDGEPLGGGSTPEQDFAPIAGAAAPAGGTATSLFD